MKKLLHSVFALAGILTLSCSKEAESPVSPIEEAAKNFTTYTITATLGDQTRTAYADFQKFSWLAGDKIDVFTYNEDEEMVRITGFEAQEDGVTTTFVGDVEEGYYPSDLAVYPDNAVFINSTESVYLPSYYIIDGDTEEYYTASSANPLENLTLIGRVNDDQTAYAFKTAVGAVKFTFNDLPTGSKFLRIYAPEEKIAGYFYIDENDLLTNESAVPGSYTDSEGRSRDFSGHNLWYEFTPENGSVTLYIPLPVGKLSAGTTFYIEDADENPLYQRVTVKDIAVERNKVTEIAALSCKASWKSLGAGKFVDNFNWSVIGKDNVGTYVNVQIQVDEMNPSHYRLVNPYSTAFATFKYSPKIGTAKPSPYFDLYIDPQGHVYHPMICSGVYYAQYTEATYLISPVDAYGEMRGMNIVAKYQADGKTPANIVLGPSFYWPTMGYWTGDSYYYDADCIQIIFPGETEAVDISCSATYVEIVDDNVNQPVALATVDFGKSISACNVIIAKDAEAAKAALAAGNIGGTGSTSGADTEVLLPADAESDNYYLFANPVPAEGLAPVVGTLLIPSESAFQYIRMDAADVTLEEILGTYTATDGYMLYNKPYWDAIEAGEEDPEENEDDLEWHDGVIISFTLEESDDEGLGEVMMTAFTEDAIGFCDIDTPIYASFEPKTGSLTFQPMQPIYSFTNDNGELIEVQLANANNFRSSPLVFNLSLDRTTYVSQQFFGYVFYFTEQDGFNYPDIWFSPTNYPQEFVKEGAEPAPAPARVPAVQPRFKKCPHTISALRTESVKGKPLSFNK